jgi:probable HAF family extracellular repeat protein
MKLACAAVVALGSLVSVAPVPAAQESGGKRPREVVVLSTFGGPDSVLRAVNDRGQAVGYSGLASANDWHALLWETGRMVDLGVLPGDDVSQALDINDRGQIVGTSGNLSTGKSRAVLWQDGRMTLISPPDASADCAGIDINHHGVIAGYCENAAVVWRDGAMVRIDIPGFFQALATAINDKGATVGASLDFELVQSGFLWRDGQVIELADSGHTMVPWDINNRGQIVGYAEAFPGPNETEPVIWKDGRITPLSGTWGSFHGFAWGINDRGEVVLSGHDASHANGTGDHAYVWADGELRLLPGAVAIPFDINQHGVAVGSVQDATGFQRGIIWPSALTRPRGNGP